MCFVQTEKGKEKEKSRSELVDVSGLTVNAVVTQNGPKKNNQYSTFVLAYGIDVATV